MAKINYKYYDGNDVYNDGKIEEKLLEKYMNNSDCYDKNEDMFFYTTQIRENILNWYPFKENCRILEIGSGTGAVTGALLKKAKKVISVEGSRRRSEIVYYRHKKADNLEVFCGNFKRMEFSEKFDYIVLVGVFEYARMFYDSQRPFDSFIEDMKKILKDDGKILIAIENRFGIKYFCGFSEDHLKEPWIGLEGYENKKVCTFGKEEFKRIIESHNMFCRFYNVYPDYKLPSFIYSDDFKISNFDLVNYKNYNYYKDSIIFDEKKVLQALNDNQMANDFANSFLAEITPNKDFSDINYVKFQNERNSKYQIATVLSNTDVKKIPLSKDAVAHLTNLMNVHKELNKHNIRACNIEIKNNELIIEKIVGNTIMSNIEIAIADKNYIEAERLIDDFVKYLKSISKTEDNSNLLHDSLKVFGSKINVLPISLLDLHLDNIIEKDGKYILIDQEWTDNRKLPIEYNIFVALNVLYYNIPQINKKYNIQYFYDKYKLTTEKINALVETNKYYFFEYKKFKNSYVEKVLNENSATLKMKDTISEMKNTENEIKTEIKEIEEEKTFFRSLSNDYKKRLKRYESELNEKNNLINHLSYELNEQKKCFANINEEYNHRIYKIANKIRKIIFKIIPVNSFRRKIGSDIIKIAKSFLKMLIVFARKAFNYIYNIIPNRSIKRKVANILYNSKKLSKISGYYYNGFLPKRKMIVNNEEFVLTNITYTDKRIAVHLHLFYEDLSNEFCEYLKNIPYKFDLYISTQEKANIKRIRSVFKKITNINKLVIKKSKNCGRDYGPMFVLFKNELKEYDYLLHIHSKKSLRTGSEQSEWRKYLLRNLMGTREMVMQYFDLLINCNVGIAYPSTYPGCMYLCHTYLGAKGLAEDLYKKLDLKLDDVYLNFSAGSMFWCNVELIKDVFELNLQWEDFGSERGQDDGTLEYVMERMFDPLCKKKKFNYATFNPETNKFYLNYGERNLSEYYEKDKISMLNKLMQFPIITFDIFDTLVTRKVYDPSEVFELIDMKVSKKYSLEKGKFIDIRKRAEYNIRASKKFIGDCTIDEIYSEMNNICQLSEKELLDIKNIEIETDLNTIIAREDMLYIYRELIKNNKQIILISDMYYTKDIIEKILKKCGYNNYFDILLSSELGFRKDNGTMWDYYFKQYNNNNNSIHVGDNEESDIHMLLNRGKAWEHVMQGRKMYELSDYYLETNDFLENKIMRGLIVNKSMFNSPFALDKKRDGGVINNLYDYGYSILGPIFLYFFDWLIKHISGNTKILFISREGYYLQKIYKHIINKSNKISEADNVYFLTSRRAVTVANIKNVEDIRNIFNTHYNGSLKELFYYRIGLKLPDDIKNIEVSLPRDIDMVLNLATKYMDEILQIAKNERNNYLEYINKTLKNDINKELMVIDLGYSGSVQYELSKLIEKNVSGAYFIVSNNLKPLSIGAKVISCFNNIMYDNSFSQNPIGKYSLFLESLLTSPKGQLIRFNKNGNPVYIEEKNKEKLVEDLDIIYKGIIDFISDMSSVNCKDISELQLDKNYILNNFRGYIEKTERLNSKLMETLKVEDYYTSNMEISAINN